MIPYNAIPNGIFLDEEGIVRYICLAGFSVDNDEHFRAVRRLIDGEIEQIDEDAGSDSTSNDVLRRELSDTKFALAVQYLSQNRTDDALAELQSALELNPNNFVIRKQIWAIKFPEKFHPTIDRTWQKEQLAKEQDEEARRRADCGPDGCAL